VQTTACTKKFLLILIRNTLANKIGECGLEHVGLSQYLLVNLPGQARFQARQYLNCPIYDHPYNEKIAFIPWDVLISI